MAVVGEPRDLPQPQLAAQEAHCLVVESVLDGAPVDLGVAHNEAPLVDATGLALAVGEDVEVGSEDPLEELWAPAAAVEHDSHAAFAHEGANLGENVGRKPMSWSRCSTRKRASSAPSLSAL